MEIALADRKKEGFDWHAMLLLAFLKIFWSTLTNEQIILKPLDIYIYFLKN